MPPGSRTVKFMPISYWDGSRARARWDEEFALLRTLVPILVRLGLEQARYLQLILA